MNKKLRELIIFACLYGTLIAFYFSVSKGVPAYDEKIAAIIILLAAFISILPYYFFKEFSLCDFLPEFILAMLYSITRPLLAYLAYHDTEKLLIHDFDVVEGPLIFATLAFLRIFYSKLVPPRLLKLVNSVYIFLLLALTLPILFNIASFALFQRPLTLAAAQAVFQTNITEASEYLLNLPLVLRFALPCALLLITYTLVRLLLHQQTNYSFRRQRKFFAFTAILVACTVTWYCVDILPEKTKTLGVIVSTQKYFSSIKDYKNGRSALLQNLQLTSQNKTERPHTIMLVIGESATRDYLKAFTEDMQEDTTPWLTQTKTDPDMLLFTNAYSCAHATVPTLEHALTEANYYNNKEFYESLSIIDIAKKAGYKTYWFSNQGKVGPYDTPITLVAETADVAEWTSGNNYDDALLPYLERIDKNENNFVVIHLYGSHIYYNHRYPQEYQKWTEPGETGKLADYKNSLLFTDHVLQEIYTYGQDKLNMDAMLYLSDHGSKPGVPRDPDKAPFVVLRVPFFIYLSPAYQNEHKQIAATLRKNEKQYFTNDLLYNLVCGVLDIQSNHYDASESIASPKYKFDLSNLKTDRGKQMVKDDPSLK